MAFITHGVYHYVVLNFTNPTALLDPTWSLLAQVILTCITDLIARCIFARRIWLLSGRNNILLFIILVTSIFVFATGMAYPIRGFFDVSFKKMLLESWLLYTALGGGVCADVLIAASLCVLLDHSRTGFKSTDSLVNILMLYTINTGLLTSVCAMACFVTFSIWPSQFVFIGIYFVLAKLYLNSVLAVLNTREFLRSRNSGVTTIPKSPSAIEPLGLMPSVSDNLNHDSIDSPQHCPLKLAFHKSTRSPA
ncbi:hypothetical protein BYT27DRAFT_6374264 [Phlegmacium glaucopus]|nr:hypothetical protein BYT27DRAFT_6374264 [Phlegmacium glaucopus]